MASKKEMSEQVDYVEDATVAETKTDNDKITSSNTQADVEENGSHMTWRLAFAIIVSDDIPPMPPPSNGTNTC